MSFLKRVPLFILVLLQVFPVYIIVLTSFKEPVAIMDGSSMLWPTNLYLENFIQLFQKEAFLGPLLRSLFIAIATSILSLVLSIPFCFGVVFLRQKTQSSIAKGLLAIRIIPPVVLALPMFLLFRKLSLHDSELGLILAHSSFCLPFTIWMLQPFFNSIPKSFWEVGQCMGMSSFQLMRTVAMPLVKPGLWVGGLFAFMMSWNDYLFSMILSGAETPTAPLIVGSFLGGERLEWGAMTAASVVLLVPVLFISYILFNNMSETDAVSGIKG